MKNSIFVNPTMVLKGVAIIFVLYFLLACTDKAMQIDEIGEDILAMTPVTGSRIAWDFKTLKRISRENSGYNGYARVIQLHNGDLMCVYESSGNVVVVTSKDLGASWSEPLTVAARQNGTNMAVPDILELQDQSILICFNPRPYEIDPSRKFGIRTIKSYDGGITWKDERLLYEAGHEFENGCWEPAAIQLSDGEIQLFFANEGIYTQSSEQNISLLRSFDQGLSWTEEPEIVSFRAGSRDGMPVPLILQDEEKIVFAIEDNGIENFKPYIIHGTKAENWSTLVDGNSDRRTYALAEPVTNRVYAGAPYLNKLKNGEVVLSYQGTENRTHNLENADMKVVIGTSEALNFNRKSVPFSIPLGRSALWNSVRTLGENKVAAVTSTNAFSTSGVEVWMIMGHVLEEIKAPVKASGINSSLNGLNWEEDAQVFIGHRGSTQMKANLSYDDQNLYVNVRVQDEKVITGVADLESNDGVTTYLDIENKSYSKPHTGTFAIFLSADNHLSIKEGKNGNWVRIENDGVLHTSNLVEGGYVQELAIPWGLIGQKPEPMKRIGLNMRLTEFSGQGSSDYTESISANNEDQPYTWMTLFLN